MSLVDIKPFFEWLQIHPFFAGVITYVISFFECLTFIGLLIPGTVIMTAIGTLIGIGVLPFITITLWAIAGAITGDVLSFWLGRHYHHYTTNVWPFRRYPQLLEKGKTFFEKHGGKSIFAGRFVGPIRAVLPFIAGMLHMSYRQFLIADIISAFAWAPIYMLPGILLGQASRQLPPEVASKLILFVVLLLLSLWVMYFLIKSCYAWFSRLLDKQIAYLWKFTINHPHLRMLSSFLMDPHAPQSHTQLTLAILCIVSLIGFLLLAFSVLHHGIVAYFDEPVYYLMRSLRQTSLDNFFVTITELSPRILFFFWAIILTILFIKRNYWAAFHWGLIGILSFGLGEVLKDAMSIPRPLGLVKLPSGTSFPSGHTLSGVTILGFFTTLITLENSKKWQRVLIYSLVITSIILIMISRIYLTAHWLSDVLGGALLGISIITGLTLSYRRKKTNNLFLVAKLGPIGLVILLFLWVTNLFHEYHQQLQNFQLSAPQTQTLDMKNWWDEAGRLKPTYQMNRFGRAVEILNVQWADELSEIKFDLEKNGWRLLPGTKFLTNLYHLSLRQHDPTTPLFITANGGKKPILTMLKYFPSTHNLLVIKLWKAHMRFSNNVPLWAGTVHYQKTWRLQFKSSKTQVNGLVSPTELLKKDLKHYDTKNVIYRPSNTRIIFIKKP